MDKGELRGRLKIVPIKIIATIVMLYLTEPFDMEKYGRFPDILEYVLLVIMIYGMVSFFGIFYRGGRIISGTIGLAIAVIILSLYLYYADDGIIKNLVLYGIGFGGFVLDVIAMIAFIVISKKEKKTAKRAAEYEETTYLRAMQGQEKRTQTDDYIVNHNALQEVVNQYYESVEKAKNIFSEILIIVEKNHLDISEMQMLADEHDNIINISEVIATRIREGNYQNGDLKSFRDKMSECYTDMEILIRKLTTYLQKIKD